MALILIPLILALALIGGILLIGTLWWLFDFIRSQFFSA